MRNGGRKPVPPKEGEVLTEEEIKARADQAAAQNAKPQAEIDEDAKDKIVQDELEAVVLGRCLEAVDKALEMNSK